MFRLCDSNGGRLHESFLRRSLKRVGEQLPDPRFGQRNRLSRPESINGVDVEAGMLDRGKMSPLMAMAAFFRKHDVSIEGRCQRSKSGDLFEAAFFVCVFVICVLYRILTWNVNFP